MLKHLYIFICVFIFAVPAEAKYIVFGVDTTYPPMESVDTAHHVIGFGPDLITAAGKAAGFTPIFRESSWDDLFTELENKKVDAVLASVTITESRKRKMDFSEPYFTSYQAVIVRKDAQISSVDDLAGKRIGALESSTSYDVCKEIARHESAMAKPFPHPTAAIASLKDGSLDAAIIDAPAAFGLVLDHRTYSQILKLGFLVPTKNPEPFGIAVRKGDTETLELINKGLAAVRNNGEYQKIYDKWLAQVPSKPESKGFFQIPWLSHAPTNDRTDRVVGL
jgi:polar amino acid transport system substrate-binding protein